MQFKRWSIVGTMAILLATVFALSWGDRSITEDNTKFLIRFTARSSCLAFLFAFIAAPLHRLWKSPLSYWLSQNRRFFGLSMTVSHTYHAIAVSTLQIAIQHQPLHGDPLSILGYVFLIGMTVTSFHSTAKAIGRQAWRVLHTSGMYYFWLAFAMEFGRRSMQEWGYLFLTLLIASALIIRLLDRRKLVPLVSN